LEGIGMSLWENHGNGNMNKCLAGIGMGIGLKLMGMGKLRAIPVELYYA